MRRTALGATAVLVAAWGWLSLSADVAALVFALVTAALTAAALLAWRLTSDAGPATAPDPHLATIEALATAIEAREDATPAHARRVRTYAVALARAVGLADAQVQAIRLAAVLHDIGMLAVPEHILTKPAPLTEEEVRTVRRHPHIGAALLAGVSFPQPVTPLIRSHHERWDGRGYPDGLVGEDIPMGARILSIAEMFDALTNDRPYHKALSRDAALKLLEQEAGTSVDPALVARFVETLPTIAIADDDATVTPEPAGDAAGGHARPRRQAEALYGAITQAHQEMGALYELSRSLGTSLGVTESMTRIAAKLKQLVPYSCCALFLQHEDEERLLCRYASGTDADIIRDVTVKIGEGLSGWVARARQPLVNASPRLDTAATTSLESAVVIPLVFQDRFIGTLALYHTEPDCYTDDHARVLGRVGAQIAGVIANSLLFDKAQEDSLTDPLTGLPNTRSLFMHLTRELARAKRLDSQLALLVIDLDDFKLINDRHGHHVGDRALCEVARVLRSAIRPYDICVRYAGDEFILVLSGCSDGEAHRKRRDLQVSLDDTVVEAGDGERLRLCASVGVAMFPVDGDSYETLLAVADRRMYQEKTRQKHRASGSRSLEGQRYSDDELTDSSSGVL